MCYYIVIGISRFTRRYMYFHLYILCIKCIYLRAYLSIYAYISRSFVVLSILDLYRCVCVYVGSVIYDVFLAVSLEKNKLTLMLFFRLHKNKGFNFCYILLNALFFIPHTRSLRHFFLLSVFFNSIIVLLLLFFQSFVFVHILNL